MEESKSWVEKTGEVKGYLKPQKRELFLAYAKTNEMSNSKVLNVIVNDFFNRMSPEDRARILRQANNGY